jgi:hypothetical protein
MKLKWGGVGVSLAAGFTGLPSDAVWTAPEGAVVGSPVSLDGSASTGDLPLTCVWDFDGFQQRDGCDIEFTFAGAGTKSVTLFVTDSHGDVDSNQQEFVVSGAAEPTPTPQPTATPDPSVWPPPQDADGGIPVGWPNASNTGPTNESALVSRGSLTITQNGVYENMRINGVIRIAAGLCNVTIRNTVVDTTQAHPIQPLRPACPTTTASPAVIVEDTEIDCNGSATADFAMGGGDNWEARRVDVHNCADGFDMGNDVTVRDSWCHDLQDASADPHYDCLQYTAGKRTEVIHNSFDNQLLQTSAIIVKADLWEIDDVLISRNYLNGGSFTVYSREGTGSNGPWLAPTNVRIVENIFDGVPPCTDGSATLVGCETNTRFGPSFGAFSVDGTTGGCGSNTASVPSGVVSPGRRGRVPAPGAVNVMRCGNIWGATHQTNHLNG